MKNSTSYQDRTSEILDLYSEGMTLSAIGDHFGITRERVMQIVKKSGSSRIVARRRSDVIGVLRYIVNDNGHWLRRGSSCAYVRGLITSNMAVAAWSVFRFRLPWNRTLEATCGRAGCANPDHQRVVVSPMANDVEIIAANSRSTDCGCIEWTGSRLPLGYGLLYQRAHGAWRYAHRVSFELFNGKVQPGMCVCHRCDNPACINPDHLWLGTHKENMEDRDRKGRGRWGPNAPARMRQEEAADKVERSDAAV